MFVTSILTWRTCSVIWAAPRKKGPYCSCDVIEKWRHIFAVKIYTCLLENVFWLKSLWRPAKTSEPFKISELPPDSHCTINMILIFKITEVKMCVSLRKHHDALFAENDAVAYTPSLWPHRKLILTVILLNVSQTYLKQIISENRKIKILIKKKNKQKTLRTVFAWHDSYNNASLWSMYNFKCSDYGFR